MANASTTHAPEDLLTATAYHGAMSNSNYPVPAARPGNAVQRRQVVPAFRAPPRIGVLYASGSSIPSRARRSVRWVETLPLILALMGSIANLAVTLIAALWALVLASSSLAAEA